MCMLTLISCVVRIGKDTILQTSKKRRVNFPNKTLAQASIAEWELQDQIIRPTTLQMVFFVFHVVVCDALGRGRLTHTYLLPSAT